LVDDAVPLGQAVQRCQLFLGGVRVQVEGQANRAEPDRGIAVDAQRSPEVEIALRADVTATHLEIKRGRDRSQGHAGAGDQRLEEHVARAGEGAVAAGSRVKTGLDDRAPRIDGAGDLLVAERAPRAQRDQRRVWLLQVALLEWRLLRPERRTVHRSPFTVGCRRQVWSGLRFPSRAAWRHTSLAPPEIGGIVSPCRSLYLVMMAWHIVERGMGTRVQHASRAYRHRLNGSQLEPGAPQLGVEGVTLTFGGVQALDDVSLEVRQGDIHAIIGPNGAGKTSLLNCVSGLYRPQTGRIVLHSAEGEHDLVRERPHRIARMGVARSFQNIELFRHMTAVENLLLGRHVHMRHHLLPALWYLGSARRQEIAHREVVEEVIDLLEIQVARNTPVAALAYGVQKRVELGRALCMRPALLLLDEPMAGMNVEEKEDMARFILDANELAGVTVVLIEHDMAVVMDISDQVTVLDFGSVIAKGAPASVGRDQRVIDAYLGEQRQAS